MSTFSKKKLPTYWSSPFKPEGNIAKCRPISRCRLGVVGAAGPDGQQLPPSCAAVFARQLEGEKFG
ncbi:hypothetical protein E2C01_090005 [Portunus trituberculatus]|uniref:Uncharacterized protein n=1 Tax=Portunus trituberculatus TaxID=210409 RepID=A0A5B7JJ46_PORTR|nr:hypothetical protein [Portunus trituberculatus]